VKNLIGMDDDARTVAIAFPAYIGRVKVVAWEEESCSSDVTSEMAGAPSLAAMRGRSDFAKDEVAETTWVKGDELDNKCSKRGDTVSGSKSEYCGDVECRIDVKPFNFLALPTTSFTCSSEPITRPVTLPPNCWAAVRADSEPELSVPWWCSRKTRACGEEAAT